MTTLYPSLNFGFGETLDALRDTVHRFAQAEIAPRAAAVDANNEFPMDLWKKFGDLGVLGMTVAEAVEAPRWRNPHSPTESSLPHECDNLLYVERRFPDQVLEGLKSKGHVLDIIGDWEGKGSEVMIQVDPETGVLSGAADPRRDGYAIGW